ncbi:MAG: histidine kinase [Acidobacteria bacterium]|nr:histidine kinase [Acidobacteriota bacterium]MBV9477964.1 histidine kinase [Acidobacteriota bacterium]
MPLPRRRGGPSATLIATIFAAATVLYAVHLVVFLHSRGDRAPWLTELAESTAHWAPWLLLLAPVFALAQRFRLGRASSYAVHVPAAVAVALIQIVVRATLDQPLIHGQWTLAAVAEGISSLIGRTFFANVITYFALVIVHEVTVRERAQREAAAERERQLGEARLLALQNQMQPHFLFNALNGISALMHQDVDAAHRMLLGLANLLRAFLDDSGAAETTVAREEELLRDYLAVEQARLGERLRVDIDIDAVVRRALVPRFILQPLVENAIRHGIAAARGGGSVHVSVAPHGERLAIRVEDDGRGLRDEPRRGGIGIRNTVARLEHLYGDAYAFELRNREPSGVVARIEVPLHFAKERG